MRLQSIILINRAPFEHLELNLCDDNITIFSGINGSGKTTIISYIVDSFYELAKIAYFNEFEDKNNKFYRISSRIYSIDSSCPSIVYLRFIKNNGSFVDYIDITGDISHETYDKLINIHNKIDYSKIYNALNENNVIKYWNISDVKEINYIFYNNIITYFPAYRYETPSFLNDPYSIKFNFNKDAKFHGYIPNPIEVISDMPQIANWIMDIVLDSQIYKGKELTLFNQINYILNSIVFEKIKCVTRLGIGKRNLGMTRIAIMDRNDGDNAIYPSIFCMSSGELALLCLFCELVRQTDNIEKMISDVTGIVLVDEIDKHLHIRLQKEILPKLIKIFPNIQFIVSSHSPFFGLGISDNNIISYKIYDLDNDGIPCQPQDNDLYKEVYNMMISENERYASKYKDLYIKIQSATKPFIITEGKTDWKHIKAAMESLKIVDLDIDFYEYDDSLGDTRLLHMLEQYAVIKQPRIIIGIFDRDNFNELKCNELKSQEFVSFNNSVYGFAIPIVNQDEYGEEISIEHYYTKKDLTKPNTEQRRLFLGNEFYESGVSKEGRFHTRIKGIDKKSKNNGIIDEKVYDISKDPEEKNSIAMSKSEFVNLIINDKDFAHSFDYTNFNKIINVIRNIIAYDKSQH